METVESTLESMLNSNLPGDVDIKEEYPVDYPDLNNFQIGKGVDEFFHETGNESKFTAGDTECLQLKSLVQDAKKTLEQAQIFATKISVHQIILSEGSLHENFNEVSSSLEQAVISTTVSLSAIDNIITVRASHCDDVLKEEQHTNVIKGSKVESSVKNEDGGSDSDPDFDGGGGGDFIDDIEEEEEYTDFVPKKKPAKSKKGKRRKDEDSHFCDSCDFSTNSSHKLKAHKYQNHTDKKFICEECDYVAARPQSMKLHMKKKHDIEKVEYLCDRENPGTKLLLCDLCNFFNADPQAIQDHMNDFHFAKKVSEEQGEEKLEEYNCSKCTYTTTNKDYFEDHMTGSFKYRKCPWCDQHVAKFPRLSVHLKQAHGVWIKGERKYFCPDCGQKFDYVKQLLPHMVNIHKLGPMMHCPKCDYSGISPVNLKHHMENHDVASYYCTECSRVEKSLFRLNKHMRTVHGGGIVCEECGGTYPSKESLYQHKRGVHEKTLIRYPAPTFERKCEECDFVTNNYNSLYYHKAKHHEVKTFHCDECDFSASKKFSLDLHIKSKHEKKRWNCDECEMTFAAPMSLKKHKKVKHTNMPTIRCKEPGCNYEAKIQQYMKLHMEKVHLGIRWPCNKCDYVGPYKGDLNRHIKKVHNVIPAGCVVYCDLCDFNTKAPATLMSHKKKVHNIESC